MVPGLHRKSPRSAGFQKGGARFPSAHKLCKSENSLSFDVAHLLKCHRGGKIESSFAANAQERSAVLSASGQPINDSLAGNDRRFSHHRSPGIRLALKRTGNHRLADRDIVQKRFATSVVGSGGCEVGNKCVRASAVFFWWGSDLCKIATTQFL